MGQGKEGRRVEMGKKNIVKSREEGSRNNEKIGGVEIEQEKGGKCPKWKIKKLARARRGSESGRIGMVN